MEILIKGNNSPAPLYHQYPDQHGPQHGYIDIDPEFATITADWNGEIGNAVPINVWNGKVVRLSVSPYLKRSALEDLLQEVKLAWETGNCDEEALQIICDASSSDDSNLVTVWHAYDVAQNMSQQITAATTDDELAELATAAHAAAVEEMALIVGEMDKELADIRDDLL